MLDCSYSSTPNPSAASSASPSTTSTPATTKFASDWVANLSCCPNHSPGSSARSPRHARATPPSATQADHTGCSPAAGRDVLSALSAWPNASTSSVSIADSPRSAALFQLATDLPAAILAKMLGIHIAVAVTWQRASAGDWTNYTAEVSRRAPGGQPQ